MALLYLGSGTPSVPSEVSASGSVLSGLLLTSMPLLDPIPVSSPDSLGCSFLGLCSCSGRRQVFRRRWSRERLRPVQSQGPEEGGPGSPQSLVRV